jgi:5-methylthioadenosine/S-adenosylhomocysteine deaminase
MPPSAPPEALPANAEIALHPRWLIPVEPEGEVLEGHSLLLSDGRITAVAPRAQLSAVEVCEQVELPQHVLLPGLVNAHGHAAMSLLRGYADDLPLMPWLEQHIWPAEQAHAGAAFVRAGVRLALLEMLCSGTTTFSDMYFFPEVTGMEAERAGVRCQLAFPVFEFPSAWGSGAEEYLSKGLALRDECRHSPLLSVVFGPHAPYTVSEAHLAQVAMLADELDVGIQTHLHETAVEVEQAVAERGERPLATLARLGLLGPRTQCVHMTQVDESDLAQLVESGAHIIHCPQSNMKLASGTCPVVRLQSAGLNLGLGTDGAASNNALDLFAEMRTTALLAKLHSGDAAALPAARALSMATLGGARALGLEDRIGSLLPGKQADLIAVDLSAAPQQPVYNPLSQLVYTAAGAAVSHSWIAGRAVLVDGELQTLELRAVLADARQWQHIIAGGRHTG